jgi:predicted Co/Zn/Cd cation transporter (cation efflux family)
MNRQSNPTKKRGLTAIDGALALIALLLIVQMWLLTATLESYLAGHREVALPAAIISGLSFLVCAGLYLFVRRVDAEARQESSAKGREEQPYEAPLE